jgi:lysyl-tRNA synthetase class I
MQELINKLISEVGLSAEQAQKTVETVMTFVKSKVPSAFAANIDAMFSGVQSEVKQDSYKEKAEDFAEATKEKLEEMAGSTKEKLEDFAEQAKKNLSEAADKAEVFAEQAKEKLSEAADKAEDLAKDAFDKIKGMFGGSEKKA